MTESRSNSGLTPIFSNLVLSIARKVDIHIQKNPDVKERDLLS